ncbi:hypothetical protein F1D05_01830 [Kribbella qitaiheensis]|uniref:Uncharacterized protein n=1 Tax=Kribbella qitaiheensis TaxID=1544730 RepID=A0A7G6WSA0_9ACTN|nr:hypothetical protein [Kribbella qitaiheensis]QNE16865.1 hypothetical protein F1D05_01830 [Kribbella qitaiheensis]
MTLTNAEENPHAGKGSSVLLDIGDDVGAIVITLPADLEDVEIERRPVGWSTEPAADHDHEPAADHDHGHAEEHGHGHGEHSHRFPHVAVVPRSSPDGELVHSAVFFDVPEGSYELHALPDGPVRLTVEVTGGHVTEATWPE